MNWLRKLFGLEPIFGGVSRSPEWSRVRATWIKEHPNCAVCGSTKKVQCHHQRPYHLHPELELDSTNFITLCEDSGNHHLWIGHLGNFQSFNVNVEEDSAHLLQEIKSRP